MIRKALSPLLEIPGTSNRITPMEGMRGYAVLLVFLVHHHTLFGYLLPPASTLHQLSQYGHDIGHSGVDLFFVLSGYLIYGHLFQKSPEYFSYLRKRIHRVYPTFFFITCLYLVACFSMPSISKLPHPAGQGFLYILENLLFLPGIFPIEPLITVTWSLSYEFFFYLSIPLLLNFTRMRSWSRTSRTVFFAALFVVHCIGFYYGFLPHIRLNAFLVGILLYELFAANRVAGRLSRSGELLAILAYALTLVLLIRFSAAGLPFNSPFPSRAVSASSFLCAGLFGLTLYSIGFRGLLHFFFTSTPFRALGNMSYTYFLSHSLVLNAIAYSASPFLRPASFSAPAFLALLVATFLATFMISLALFLLVEKPFSLAVSAARSVPAAGQKPETVPVAAAE